jgi:hypothetical protein
VVLILELHRGVYRFEVLSGPEPRLASFVFKHEHRLFVERKHYLVHHYYSRVQELQSLVWPNQPFHVLFVLRKLVDTQNYKVFVDAMLLQKSFTKQVGAICVHERLRMRIIDCAKFSTKLVERMRKLPQNLRVLVFRQSFERTLLFLAA